MHSIDNRTSIKNNTVNLVGTFMMISMHMTGVLNTLPFLCKHTQHFQLLEMARIFLAHGMGGDRKLLGEEGLLFPLAVGGGCLRPLQLMPLY